MDLGFRTLLRVFLLVAGLVYIGLGIVRGSLFSIALGAAAVTLGTVGLWWEWNQQSTDA